MANEVIARKGLISLSDTQLTGSLLVSASQGSGVDLYVSGSAANPRVGIGTTSPAQALHVNGHIALTGRPDNNRYIILNETNTGETAFHIQAGGGSTGYGGSFSMYGHAHDSLPGWAIAGISNGSGGKFAVTPGGCGTGTAVFTVDASGNVDISAGGHLYIAATKKLYLDSGGNTYFHEVSADKVDLVVGGQTILEVAEGGGGASDYVAIQA